MIKRIHRKFDETQLQRGGQIDVGNYKSVTLGISVWDHVLNFCWAMIKNASRKPR